MQEVKYEEVGIPPEYTKRVDGGKSLEFGVVCGDQELALSRTVTWYVTYTDPSRYGFEAIRVEVDVDRYDENGLIESVTIWVSNVHMESRRYRVVSMEVHRDSDGRLSIPAAAFIQNQVEVIGRYYLDGAGWTTL